MSQGVSLLNGKAKVLSGCCGPKDTSKNGANNSCSYALKLGRRVVMSTMVASHASVPEPRLVKPSFHGGIRESYLDTC